MNDVSKQGRMIVDMDANVDVTLKDVAADIDLEHANKVLSMQDVNIEPAELQKVLEVVTTAKLITKVVTAASATLTAAVLKLTIVAAPILTTSLSDARRRKEVKEDNVVKRYQALKRKQRTEAQTRKNMMIYLRNVAGFKMDYFKGMTYDDIRPIFEKKFNSNVAFLLKTKEQIDEEDSRALKRLSESQDDEASKKQKMDKEVPVVDYEIYNEDNKPYYKIKRADAGYTSSNLENSKKCSWSSEGQELEAVRVLWGADCHIHYNRVDFASRKEISTYKESKDPQVTFLLSENLVFREPDTKTKHPEPVGFLGRVWDNKDGIFLAPWVLAKNTDSLDTKITKLNEALSDSKTNLYHYKLGLSQVEARLIEFKTQEIKFYEKIKGLEFDVKNKNTKTENLMNELEQIKKEIEGYSAVPSPSAQVYSPPKKDMSRIGLPEFADDTIIDYNRPSPSIESNSSDLQNSNSSVSEHGGSSKSIIYKPMIKFVKVADCAEVKTNKAKAARKPSIKYAKMYRNTSKSPKVRGNQRNWNNLKTQQLGKDFVMKNKACFICGHFDHLAYDCGVWVEKGKNESKNNFAHKNVTPRADLFKTASVSAARRVNTAIPRPNMNSA
uniref:Ubiquitin hydrolase n=1 Tax=Tanacetum cinerariifolium TaxID=118510 RepID=A0A699HM79_TANCI|nr:ubiquitin hydrolase [Tanacetum cinerariifolium]